MQEIFVDDKGRGRKV